MNIEIRRSFVKDADSLPAPFQRQLAVIIKQLEKASQPSQLENCKKLRG
jgi:mRNA-degrading endonuclease RelE of RelBE toxin-antitoxin system